MGGVGVAIGCRLGVFGHTALVRRAADMLRGKGGPLLVSMAGSGAALYVGERPSRLRLVSSHDRRLWVWCGEGRVEGGGGGSGGRDTIVQGVAGTWWSHRLLNAISLRRRRKHSPANWPRGGAARPATGALSQYARSISSALNGGPSILPHLISPGLQLLSSVRLYQAPLSPFHPRGYPRHRLLALTGPTGRQAGRRPLRHIDLGKPTPRHAAL